jgi:hypothetical protein
VRGGESRRGLGKGRGRVGERRGEGEEEEGEARKGRDEGGELRPSMHHFLSTLSAGY